MIFETHGHYDDKKFDADRDVLLQEFLTQGIDRVMNIGADLQSSRATVALAEQYPHVYAAVGVHPSEVGTLTEQDMDELETLAHHEKVMAIGEIGLDYYYEDCPLKDVQKHWFVRQLELARKMELPVVIHSRDAAQDTLEVMKEQKAEEIGGVVHCFSYGTEMAREYLNMGFFLGIGGVLTFKNGKKLKEVVEYAPLSSLVLETDAPYLSPEPFRGERNQALRIPYIANTIAAIRNIPVEEVYRVTYENAKRLYRMQESE